MAAAPVPRLVILPCSLCLEPSVWDGTVGLRLRLTAAMALAPVPGPVVPGLWGMGAAGPKGELDVSG